MLFFVHLPTHRKTASYRPAPNFAATPTKSESTDASETQTVPAVAASTGSAGRLAGLATLPKLAHQSGPPTQTSTASAGTSIPGDMTRAMLTGLEPFPNPLPRVLPLTTSRGPKTNAVSDLLHAQHRLSLLRWSASSAHAAPHGRARRPNAVLFQDAQDHVPHISTQFHTHTETGRPYSSIPTRSCRTPSSSRSPRSPRARAREASQRSCAACYADHQLVRPRRSRSDRFSCTTLSPRSATQPLRFCSGCTRTWYGSTSTSLVETSTWRRVSWWPPCLTIPNSWQQVRPCCLVLADSKGPMRTARPQTRVPRNHQRSVGPR